MKASPYIKTCLMALPLFTVHAAEQDISSNVPDRWEFASDTTARFTADLDYRDIVREDSNSHNSPLGAIFHSNGSLLITSSGGDAAASLTIDNVSKNTAGGMIVAKNDLSFESLGNLAFTNNTGAPTTSSAVRTGIVAFSESGSVCFRTTGDILVEGNTSSNGRGIGFISSYSRNVLFEETGLVSFLNNTGSSASSSLVYSRDGSSSAHTGVVFRKTGSVRFEDNTAQGIYSISGVLLSGIDRVVFRNNANAQDGAAIFSRSFAGDGKSVSIVQCGEVLFEGNKAGARGGAIEVELLGDANEEVSVLLSADKGNIVFKGNFHENDATLGYANPSLNSIYVNVNSTQHPAVFGKLDFRAAEGREISFYDPVVTAQFATGQTNQTGITAIDFNKTADPSHSSTAEYGGAVPDLFGGVIRFSGKEAAQYITRSQTSSETASAYQARLDKSRYSNVIAHTVLHDGTLVVEEDAVYGHKDLATLKSKGMLTSFTVARGVLDMNARGTINACDLTFAGSEAVIRVDGTGIINALTAAMDNGIGVDLQYYFSGEGVVNHSGLLINADTFALGGLISIRDDADGFYADDRWATDQMFTLFTLNKKSSGTFGSFDGIESGAFGSTTVDGAGGYRGIWSFAENTSGNKKVINAYWTVTGNPIPEPSSLLLICAGASASLRRRRQP